jgi:Xaa-Pro aminopeptidase
MNSFAIALEVLLTPIIASGNNANVLHYIENNQQCKAGDLILLDVAAEYANYSSDMSRTIPVSGRYTKRQEVYNAVLNVKTKLQNADWALWKQYHIEVEINDFRTARFGSY